MPKHAQPPFIYFWEHVVVAGPDDCWLWTGTTRKDGLPVIRRTGGVCLSARRLAWDLQQETPLTPRQRVVTTCGERRCMNPTHLQSWTLETGRRPETREIADTVTDTLGRVAATLPCRGCVEGRHRRNCGYARALRVLIREAQRRLRPVGGA